MTPWLIVAEMALAAVVAGLGAWSIRRRRPVDARDWIGLVVLCMCVFALLSGILAVLTGRVNLLDTRLMAAQVILLLVALAAWQQRRTSVGRGRSRRQN